MLLIAALGVLGIAFLYLENKDKDQQGERFSGLREAAKNPWNVYDFTNKIRSQKAAVGADPFSGQGKNSNPRAPPPFIAPVPKLAQRIDWKSPSSSSFLKDPAFREANKRIHQLVYGTPTVMARKGQLTSDWGYNVDQGYPIHRGRAQSWLPGNYEGRKAPFVHNAMDLPMPENQVGYTHFDLSKR